MEKEDFIGYCNKNWDVPYYEVEKALDVMDKSRCPLDMANNAIVDKIRDLADDFETDNNLSDDWFCKNFDDEEEVFWKLDIFKTED